MRRLLLTLALNTPLPDAPDHLRAQLVLYTMGLTGTRPNETMATAVAWLIKQPLRLLLSTTLRPLLQHALVAAANVLLDRQQVNLDLPVVAFLVHCAPFVCGALDWLMAIPVEAWTEESIGLVLDQPRIVDDFVWCRLFRPGIREQLCSLLLPVGGSPVGVPHCAGRRAVCAA